MIDKGLARFTVITPTCIRMEYSPRGVFSDAPTLFAINREPRYDGASVTSTYTRVTIDTGRIRLEYTEDGKPFHPGNLRAWIRKGDAEVAWEPGRKNESNLGGPLSTVDGVSGPVPLPDGILARDGWFLLDDTGQAILVDGWARQPARNAVPDPDWYHAKAYTDWYLFGYGTDYKSALDSLAAISGRVPMPRRHVHGSWYCRWYPYTDAQFLQIVEEYKTHDFPLDVLVMDMDWHTMNANYGNPHANNLGWTGYTWNRDLIADPDALMKRLADEGVFVTVNDHPHDGVRDHEECYPTFMRMLGFEPAKGHNIPFNASDRKYMEAFFRAAHDPLERQGVDFWWVDWQQDSTFPYVYGVPGLKHLPWLNHLYYKNSEKNGRRGQGFSRWGGWGDHRNPIQFSGDCDTGWDMLAFEVDLTAASGNAGCFFWAHDIGGFWGDRRPETYARWVQFGALSSSLRLHSCGEELDRRPWLWGEPFVGAMREAFHFRSRLFPYIYTSIRQCYDDTLALVRPMYIEYPDKEQAYQCPQQYLLGNHLLAAPIVSPGTGPSLVAERSVWFPEGVWYNLFTGEKFEGDRKLTVSADITEIPVFARAGVPIPMQPYTPKMGTEPISTLVVRCYPGETGDSVLYEDDGQTLGYTHGECARTPLHYARQGDVTTVTIGPTEGKYEGQPTSRAYRIELPCTLPSVHVTINGHPGAGEYDPAQAMNIVTVPEQSIAQPVEVVVEAKETDAS